MEEHIGENREENADEVTKTSAGSHDASGGNLWPSPPKKRELPAMPMAPLRKPVRGRDFFYSLLLGLLCHAVILFPAILLFLAIGWGEPNFDYPLAVAQILTFWVIMRFVVDKRESGRDIVGLKWPEEPGLWVQATIIYFLFRAAVYFLYFRHMGPMEAKQYTDMEDYALTMLLMVVIAPPVEELIFRGVGLAGYSHTYPVWFAVVLTSIGFSLLHDGYWSSYHFLMGVTFCLIRLRTRSLYCVMIFHGGHNLLISL